VLARHWPEVDRHDDVRTAPHWWQSQPRPHVDVVCGGFPCQPFSIAGLQAGIADARWGWPWMRDVVAAVRPRFVIVENVAALLRDTEAFSVILGELSDLGFDAEWDVVSACSVGASHTRRRLFVVAYPVARDHKGYTHRYRETICNLLREIYGGSGRPNPRWIEWLMGFPPGWCVTTSTASETPSSPQ
jgi:DNA (cytosine-5)-methyltransferase 1